MKKNFNWFSLIELIVWVSISIILMVSVWIFVTSWMKNITIQKQILDNSTKSNNLENKLNDIFKNDVEILNLSDSWMLLKTNYIFWNGAFYILEQKTQTWECENDENLETKYLSLTNFNPYILSQENYTWSYLKNVIYSGSEIIVWKWVFWDGFTSWDFWTWVYLNNPSSLTSSWDLLFITDSGNNRILYLSWSQVYTLADINDWIFAPTWILYNSWILYILNNFWKELLVLDSNSLPNFPIDLSFNSVEDINFNKIQLRVFWDDWTDSFSIVWSYNTGSYIFSWITQPWNTVTVWWTWTWVITYIFSWSTNIFSGVTYWVKIPSFTWSLWTPKSYYILMTLLNWFSSKYTKYFPYIISWDNNILTLADNEFKTLTWWLNWNYSQIILSGNNLVLNDFISWTKLEVDENWNFVSSWSLSTIPDFENINRLKDFKIKDLKVNKNWNLLTIKVDYYKYFDCYDETKNIVKTLIYKKTLSY